MATCRAITAAAIAEETIAGDRGITAWALMVQTKSNERRILAPDRCRRQSLAWPLHLRGGRAKCGAGPRFQRAGRSAHLYHRASRDGGRGQRPRERPDPSAAT